MININKSDQELILGGLNLQLFADDGEGDQTEPPEGGGTEPIDSAEPTEPTKTFTQEDVNNIATREARKAQEKLFKELGIEDFEDAKEGMTKFKEWQDAQKTDAEKKDEKLTNLEKEHSSTKAENEFLKAQISASKQGVRADSVEDVVVLAQNLVSEEFTMEEAIKSVVEKYPHFAEKQEEEKTKPRFSSGEHNASGSGDDDPFARKLAKYK